MHFSNDEIIKAICWTLLHSLWQGLLLAVLAGVVILTTKKSSTGFRYNLLAGLFLVFIVTTSLTFICQINSGDSDNQSADPISLTHPGQATGTTSTVPEKSPVQTDRVESFVNYLDAHAYIVVTVWFLILTAQLIRLMANAGYAQHLKYHKIHEAPTYWKNKLQRLAGRIHIKQRVLLFESELVRVPLMVGVLKPVILFPFSVLSQLPPEQVEAVLLHELAHIKRRDYFVNILQNLGEAIFFFNPGVLWLSSLIREERENCCDDIAISKTNNGREFINALVSFQERHLQGSTFTMTFPGKQNHLLNRVRRIVTNNNKTLTNMEKISLVSCVVAIGLTMFAFKPGKEKTELRPAPEQNIVAVTNVKDTIPGNRKDQGGFTYATRMDGKEYRLKEDSGRITAFYIDENRIPDDKLKDYQEIIDRLHTKMKETKDELMAKKMAMGKQMDEVESKQEMASKKLAELEDLHNREIQNEALQKVRGQDELAELLKQRNELEAKIQVLQMIQKKRNDEDDAKEHLSESVEMEKSRADAMARLELLKTTKGDILKQIEQLRETARQDPNNQISLDDLKNQIFAIDQAQKSMNLALLKLNQEGLSNPASSSAGLGEIQMKKALEFQLLTSSNDVVGKMINEMLDEKLITSRNELSFTLNNKFFKINEVIQPEEVFQHYRDNYIKGKSSNHIVYSKHDGSSSSINISIEE